MKLLVKIAFGGERFWVIVTSIRKGRVNGIIDNKLLNPKLKYGDLISFSVRDILDIADWKRT